MDFFSQLFKKFNISSRFFPSNVCLKEKIDPKILLVTKSKYFLMFGLHFIKALEKFLAAKKKKKQKRKKKEKKKKEGKAE